MTPNFDDAVAEVLLSLAKGEVVSYRWVAAEAGYPGRARAVGRFLALHGHGLPWWRVVRADGSLAAPKPDRQAEALRAEGVAVVEGRVPKGLVARSHGGGGPEEGWQFPPPASAGEGSTRDGGGRVRRPRGSGGARRSS